MTRHKRGKVKKLSTVVILVLVSVCAYAQTAERSDSVMARYLESENINISRNNSLVLLTSGKEKFRDMFAAISKARHSVHLEYFNFRNDSIAGALNFWKKRQPRACRCVCFMTHSAMLRTTNP